MIRLKSALFAVCLSLMAVTTQADDDILKDYDFPTRPAMNSQDPYEDYNRAVYQFNMAFNDAVGEPVAGAYNRYVPTPARTGISNFFRNLKEPLNTVNAFFQGNVEAGLTSFMRLAINTTFGLFGILDVATPAGLTYEKEDLGQTLYKWGVWSEASFFMVPFIGPYTTRELVGGSIDAVYNPTYPYLIETDDVGRIMLFLGEKFVDYTQVITLMGEIRSQPDPYIFMRESYMQYRMHLIYNGNPPMPELDDFNFE
ncbi:VacJ family lipoprotein [Thiomicrospira sp. XS5]|uniref:MlaA family lipoprotein n=1 Tax=Thiomicrospira sp. XS5 TaxID=1775636 RepID=UPI000AB96567|nr:VacJ family lipoprotein [Thiomicrospira sp. XS5]